MIPWTLAFGLVPAFLQPPPTAGDIAAGRAVYRDGKLASGASLRGLVAGDVTLSGAAASCSRCHRPSGFGSSEGALLVPPVTGPAVFAPRRTRRADTIRGLYQAPLTDGARASARTPRDRPAYTPAALATALRTGNDPTGRALDPLMPRYELSDGDMSALVAYLGTLSARPDPGVDGQRIHLATVVSKGADPSRRRALLSVLEAFVRSRNLNARRERDRPGFSPHFKGEYRDSIREWVLHVWEVAGPADTWGVQLDEHYRRQPVFALVSGAVDGGWSPVHGFSKRSGVPCLFPVTELPVTTDEGGSPTVYLFKGLTVEAEALGSWLSRPGHAPRGGRIVQVYRPDERGRTLAQAFRRALRGDDRGGLVDQPLDPGDASAAAAWNRAVTGPAPAALVLWLTATDLAALRTASGADDRPDVYLSGGLLDADPSSIPGPLRNRVRLTYPYSVPGEEDPQIYRARAWLRSRRVEAGPERLQHAAFFAMSVLEHSLARMAGHFSRDYLVECVEHEVENAMNPGLFPHVSLGPGQRFASKGCYVVSVTRDQAGRINPLSAWIIP